VEAEVKVLAQHGAQLLRHGVGDDGHASRRLLDERVEGGARERHQRAGLGGARRLGVLRGAEECDAAEEAAAANGVEIARDPAPIALRERDAATLRGGFG
jgi:hypothetical protein